MRLNRFYLENFLGEKNIELKNDPIFYQMKNVLKMKLGDQVSFFCNFKEAIYVIDFIDNKKAIFKFIKNISAKQNDKKIILFPSLIKKDKMEWVVQKAVELGVSEIIPIISGRSEKKNININRLNKISIEASEQCGRQDIVTVSEPINFKKAVAMKNEISFLGDSSGNIFLDKFKVVNIKKNKINIFIGPEGGWSNGEIELAKKNKVEIVRLNNNILRSETAVVAFLSLISNL